MSIFDQIKADMNSPQVKKLSSTEWSVAACETPGVLNIDGPSFTTNIITIATNLTGEDFIARNADARRIARVPQLERIALAAEEMANSLSTLRDEVRMRSGLPRYEAGQAADKAIAAFREACK